MSAAARHRGFADAHDVDDTIGPRFAQGDSQQADSADYDDEAPYSKRFGDIDADEEDEERLARREARKP